MPKPSRRTRRKRRAVRERAERRAAHEAREAANLLRAGVHAPPPRTGNYREMDIEVASGNISVGDPVVFVAGHNLIRRAHIGEIGTVGTVKSVHNKVPGPSTVTVVLK